MVFALYAENYSRFFERTDLAQSVFLANMFAIGLPLENPQKFFHAFFIPYLASNTILLVAGFLKELEYNRRSVYVENFYKFFEKRKVIALPLCLAMIFLLGIPPLQGFYWRIEFLKVVYNFRRPWSFVMYTVFFYSIGYVYLKWILAIFQNKSSSQETDNFHSSPMINGLIILCAFAILGCSFLTPN
jgi:NADH:ubiquinone oxidoreductase subunit 2 (subunit N)